MADSSGAVSDSSGRSARNPINCGVPLIGVALTVTSSSVTNKSTGPSFCQLPVGMPFIGGNAVPSTFSSNCRLFVDPDSPSNSHTRRGPLGTRTLNSKPSLLVPLSALVSSARILASTAGLGV